MKMKVNSRSLRCSLLLAAWLLPVVLRGAPTAEPDIQALMGSMSNAVRIMQEHGLPIEGAAAVNRAVEAMVRTSDPAARIFTPDEYKHHGEERSGLDYCLGMTLGMSNGAPRIVSLQTNGPAAAAGLRTNDVLLGVNGKDFGRASIVDALKLVRGHRPEPLECRIRRGGETSTVTATTSLLQLPALESVEDLPSSLSYIKVNGLFRDTGRAIVSLLRGWAETGRSGVVLDLRAASGDDLASVTEIGSLFAKGGSLLFTLRDMSDQDLSVQKSGEGEPIALPVMALVDGSTAGAAEVLAAVLNDSVRGAMLIGQTTAGDPMIRDAVELPSKDLLYVATKRLVMANGKVHAGREGVKPDVAVGPDAEGSPEYEPELAADRRVLLDKELTDKALRERVRGDAALRRAVDILLGLKALNIGPQGLSSE
jgi:carboxyl-terminal processing protease